MIAMRKLYLLPWQNANITHFSLDSSRIRNGKRTRYATQSDIMKGRVTISKRRGKVGLILRRAKLALIVTITI